MSFAHGYTMAKSFNLDGLGSLYITLAALWTAILLGGVTHLINQRKHPSLRMRNIPLSISAVALLHVYWILCMLAYVLQGYFPCATEYWIMSIYLPIGMALFHACNAQLLYILGEQKMFLSRDESINTLRESARSSRRWQRILQCTKARNVVAHTMRIISYGMVFQLAVAVTIFVISAKFEVFSLVGQPLPNTMPANSGSCQKAILKYSAETCDEASAMVCRRGWEWIPSIMWQLLWSWVFGPYLLYQIRHVADVHRWRTQTFVIVFAGLLASPMWLCALYIPGMVSVNKYYIPPLWFAPSILVIEACLILVPCYDAFTTKRCANNAISMVIEWQKSRTSFNTGDNISMNAMQQSALHFDTKPFFADTFTAKSQTRAEMYSMMALDACLKTNPQPLLVFAATRDFSGENISFLIKVLVWKKGWNPASPVKMSFVRRQSYMDLVKHKIHREQFKQAVDIYASFASLKYSQYPINISDQDLKALETIFEPTANQLYGHLNTGSSPGNVATPWDKFFRKDPTIIAVDDIESVPIPNRVGATNSVHKCPSLTHSTDVLLSSPVRACVNSHFSGLASYFSTKTSTISNNTTKRSTLVSMSELRPDPEDHHHHLADTLLPDNIEVPDMFDMSVFNAAEESIKYMVLTNTWPKFVNGGLAGIGFGIPRTNTVNTVKRKILQTLV